ncbi:hypothetical protein [Cellulosimicrobium sp. RS]|uniref:hypothetical protein n=1 Tax=Cellulosimicrobium sp. RS TaxID=3381347 RepID=UPI0038FCCF6E
MTTVQPALDYVDVGTRVRHCPTGEAGTIVYLPTWGTASVVVRFDEPDDDGEHIGAVLWTDLERHTEPPAPDVDATALADNVDEPVPYVLVEPAPAPSTLPVWVEPTWVEEAHYVEDLALLEADVATVTCVSSSSCNDQDTEGEVTLEQSVEFADVRGVRHLAKAGPLLVTVTDGERDLRYTPSQARELAAALTVAADRAETITAGGAL